MRSLVADPSPAPAPKDVSVAQPIPVKSRQPPAPQPIPVESREHPADAVRVKLDVPVPPSASPLPPTDASIRARPPVPAPPLAATAPSVASVAPLDEAITAVDPVPVDLPPVFVPVAAAPVAASPRRPQPGPAALPSRGGMALRHLSRWARVSADALDGLRLLAEAGTIYWRNWRPLLLLVAIVLLPVTAAKSCMVAAVMGSAAPSPLVDGSAATVDFSRVRQELARRAEASRAQGKIDKAALAELAALETVSAAAAVGAGSAVDVPSPVAVAMHWLAAVLATGFLVFGLAVPLAYATLSVVLVDQRAGGSPSSFIDVGALLWRRRLRLITALLPAAALVALGSALFFLPGLLAAILFLFVPAVVLFERAAGKAALLRSIALVRADAVRVVVVALAVAVLSAVVFVLANQVMPDSSRRIIVFLRIFLGDLLLTVGLPVPALAVACLYLDLRSRDGVDAAALAQAARR
jgi:hypothetical protein